MNKSLWTNLSRAASADEFCRCWLEMLASGSTGVKQAVVLVNNPSDNSFVPLAVWPEANKEMSALAKSIEEALKTRATVRLAADQQLTHVAIPLLSNDGLLGAVAFAMESHAPLEIEAVTFNAQWGLGWISNILQAKGLLDAKLSEQRITSVTNVLATALRDGPYHQVLLELCNAVARQSGASKVAIASVVNQTPKLVALSDTAWLERQTALSKEIESVAAIAVDRLQPIHALSGTSQPLQPALQSLMTQHTSASILIQPMIHLGKCEGVLVALGNTVDKEWFHALAGLLAPILVQRRRANQGLWGYAKESVAYLGERLLGQGYLLWKSAAVLLVASALALTFIPVTYRVTAKTVLEGEVQRVVAAPYEGFLKTVAVRPGDRVMLGQVLATLEDRDLALDRGKWQAEAQQHERKLREALATNDLANVQVLRAQRQQAQAQLRLVEEKLGKTSIRAPIAGLVISGDLTQQVGAPLELGKKLFELAPSDGYRVVLQVDERDIRHIETQQTGQLVVAGLANRTVDFTVTRVTPIATASDGKNFYRVEASLKGAPNDLRPGMEGIGKIQTKPHALGWVMFQSTWNWLRLTVWTWAI